jgi:hypothetical protein
VESWHGRIAPQDSETSPHPKPVEGRPGWCKAVIYELVLPHHAPANGVCHASRSSSFRSSGDHHSDPRIVTDTGVNGTEHGNERPVFPGRARRYAADAAKHGGGDGDAGAGVFPVARPGICGIRQDDGCDLVKQAPVGYLPGIILMKMFRYEQSLERVYHCLTTDGVCALFDGSQIGFDPILRHFRIGIGRENDSLIKEGGSVIHGERPGNAGAGGSPFQAAFDDVQLVRTRG